MICVHLGALLLSAVLSACCGNGSAGTSAPDQASPDVGTSFEFNATGPFSIGTSPFTATFSSGIAESRGRPDLYSDGRFAWHVLSGTSATVTFETLPSTLTFFVRTEFAGSVSDIQILDENGALIMFVTPTNVFQQIVVNQTTGQPLIGSVIVTSTSGGDVVVDDLTFGFSSAAAAVGCLVATTLEFVCVVTDVATGDFVAGIHGAGQVIDNQIIGSGTGHAAPGKTLADGSTITDVIINLGTVRDRADLNLTLGAAETSTSVSTAYDNSFEQGSDMSTVAGSYSSFDIFGDPASFSVDAGGVITSQSNSGCVGNGQISIIDPNFNAYKVTLDVTDCGALNGMYDGLGSMQDDADMDDVFEFGVFTNHSTIIGVAERQLGTTTRETGDSLREYFCVDSNE